MDKTCLVCSHMNMCSVFKTISDMKVTINHMLHYGGMASPPSSEILKYIATGCYYFSNKKHEEAEV